MTIVSVLNEDLYADGGYGALVRVFGREYAVHYVAGAVHVRSTAAVSSYARRPAWKRNADQRAIVEFANWRLAAQPAAWHAAHRALYGMEAA